MCTTILSYYCCGNLKENDLQRNGTIRRCGHVRMGLSCWRKWDTVEVGIVVLYMLKTLWNCLLPVVCARCSTLSSFCSTMSARTPPCPTIRIIDWTYELQVTALNVFFLKSSVIMMSLHSNRKSNSISWLVQLSIFTKWIIELITHIKTLKVS